MTLADEHCAPINADSVLASAAEIAALHPAVGAWGIGGRGSACKLESAFHFETFAQALAFTNAVGEAAEEEGHHPRIVTEWGRVTVQWWDARPWRASPQRLHHGRPRRRHRRAGRRDRRLKMGRIIHFEILGDDPARLAEFYRAALGWEVQSWEGAEDFQVEYLIASTGPKDVDGIDGAFMRRQFAQPVINTALVDSLDDALEKTRAAGGKVVFGPQEIPNVGTHAYCEDPEGNLFGVIQEPEA